MPLASLLVLWAWSCMGVAQDARVEVELRQGRISGASERAGWGGVWYGFRGIPYAQAPVGDLRFRDPRAAGSWAGVRNGSLAPPLCPQVDANPGEGGEAVVRGEEDCLYLNVFTPRPFASTLPVMVWIHGGAFLVGGAGEYGPLPLLTRDVVLVTLQYRLGTLGFLSTEDPALPGNLGLKDQTAALRWVRENIRDLGGDPDKVTVFGQGAGAASAHLQVLSPQAEGLFRRAILQSGNALSPWALRNDHRHTASVVGRVFNCSAAENTSTNSSSLSSPVDLNSTALVDCLRKIPFQQLVVIPSAFVKWLSVPQVMTPRVDGVFLRAHPASLLRSGLYNEVDLISGVTEVEGALAALATLGNPYLKKALLDDFASVAPALLGFEGEEEALQLARTVFGAYLPGAQVNEGTLRGLAQLISDGAYNVPNAEVLRLHCKRGRGRVFAYRLQHRGLVGATDLFNSSVGYMWVGNGDDLKYLFRADLGSNTTSRTTSRTTFPTLAAKVDQRLSSIMVRLWTNFASTGFPTPDPFLGFMWAPACSPTTPYLSLTPAPAMLQDGNARTYAFWRSLPTLRNHILHREPFSPAPWRPKWAGQGSSSSCGESPSGLFELLFGCRG